MKADPLMAQFVRERDEAVKTAIRTDDLRVFKRFYARWKAKGIYQIGLPSDEVLWRTLYKMLYHTGDATKEEKATAEMWLIAHGSSTKI
mgnify:CR=1 FL=1